MQTVCDKEQVLAALEKARAAGVEVPKNEEVFPHTPKWYERQGWNSAAISFDDMQAGIVVTIKDCPARAALDIRSAVVLAQENPAKQVEAAEMSNAILMRGHIVDVRGENKGNLFPTDHPKKEAPLGDWRKWVETLPEKVLARLLDGVKLFRNEDQARGNE